jgi:hypothetical protein
MRFVHPGLFRRFFKKTMRQTKHIFLKIAMGRRLGFLLNIFILKQPRFIAEGPGNC